MAGFESVSAATEPGGAMAGFGASAASLRYRATVSRLIPSSFAIRRWDKPWRCRERIRSIMATLSRFDMMRLRRKGITLGAYLSNLRLLKVAGFHAPNCPHLWLVLSAR
jgi:hypothetical protein